MEPKTLSKTLDPADWFPEMMDVDQMLLRLSDNRYRFEHPHRMWEYGLAAHAINQMKPKAVLDVGGGGSILAPTLAEMGYSVTVVDPDNCADWVAAQNEKLGTAIRYHQMRFEDFHGGIFDAVTCISVIEHIHADEEFIRKLGRFVGTSGILVLTTDYHATGHPQCPHHLRTYNKYHMGGIENILRQYGFRVFGGEPEYVDGGNYVNGYNFCSLVMMQHQ